MKELLACNLCVFIIPHLFTTSKVGYGTMQFLFDVFAHQPGALGVNLSLAFIDPPRPKGF